VCVCVYVCVCMHLCVQIRVTEYICSSCGLRSRALNMIEFLRIPLHVSVYVHRVPALDASCTACLCFLDTNCTRVCFAPIITYYTYDLPPQQLLLRGSGLPWMCLCVHNFSIFP